MATNGSTKEHGRVKYEFRVWGDYPKAQRKLARLATKESDERIEDCYLLGDDQSWNAKVRDSTLKVKHLVSRERGFHRWASRWHTEAETAPAPFDEVFTDLALDRPQRGKSYDLLRALEGIGDDLGPRPVFVTKRRRRYRVGSVKAEVSVIEIDGTSRKLKTIAIEGYDLEELVALRRELGLKGQSNVAVHVALENETLAEAS